MWYDKECNYQEMVLSTKALISRSIKGYNFPSRMTSVDRENVIEEVQKVMKDIAPDMFYFGGNGLSNEDREELIEAQIISNPAFIQSSEGKGVFANKEKDLCVIVNDREHIEVKAMTPGFDNSVYEKAEDMAVKLEQKLDIAFSDKYGFLNSSIKLTGTGLKILYTVCIPGIDRNPGALDAAMERVKQYEWSMYPFFPDNEKHMRNSSIYVVASVVTQGITEEELLERGKRLLNDLYKFENVCRDNLVKKKKELIQDQYFRSYGILRYSRRIDINDSLAMLSWLRIYKNYLSEKDKEDADISWKKLNTMTNMVCWDEYPQRANKMIKKNNTARAEKLRNVLKGDD